MINILYNDLKTLISASELIPEEQYRITDYVTTVAKTNYNSVGYKFDVVVTALTTNTLYEYALLMANESETYFDADALLIYNIRYNVNNIIPYFNNDWVDTNGKGCIYYMVDNKGNEAPFDFKNIKYNGKFLFNSTIDNTDTSQTVSEYNVVKKVIEDGYFKLPQVSFNDACDNVNIGTNASEVTITESSNLQIGDNCENSEFTNVDNTTIGNDLSGSTISSIDGGKIGDNNKHIIATNHTNLIIKDKNTSVTLGGGGNGVIIDSNNTDVTIGTNAKDIYINASKEVILGHNVEQFNISSTYDVVVEDDCKLFNLNETNHLTATTGCENIHTIKNDYLTLTEEVKNVTVSEGLNNLKLDGTKLTGRDTKLIIKQDEKVIVINEQTNSEVVLVEDGTTASNPNSFINDSPSDGFIYGRKDGDWEQIDTSGDYEVTYDDVVDALTYVPISTDQIGVANGLATLDAQGYVLNAQLPSYVDDIIEVDTFTLLPVTGEKGKIYIVTDSGKTYRWATTQYVTISESLTLGTGSEQAYPGNLGAALRIDVDGKANISHTHTKSEVGLNNVDNTSDLTKPISTATQTALNGKADKGTTLADYGITDAVTQTNILYADLLNLIANDELIPSSSYRITDYTTTTTQTDTQSAGHDFDVIVTALSTNELSENAKCVRKDGDTYFENVNLEAWEIKYCVDNDTNRFEWANTSIGKGVIYRMIDEYNNDVFYDFKNIQFLKGGTFVYTFGGTTDDSLTGNSTGNIIKELIVSNKLSLNFNTFGTNCSFNVFGFNSNNNTFGVYCNFNKFGDEFQSNNFGYDCYSNDFGNSCRFNNFGNEFGLNTFGESCWYNIFGSACYNNKFGNEFISNEFGDDCYFNTFGGNCSSNIFDAYCIYNTFGDLCSKNNFGVDTGTNNFGTSCGNNTFGDECTANIFGDYSSYNVFDAECRNNKFGKNCYTNTFGPECSNNNFGNDCGNNIFIESCQFNKFGNDCDYNTFSTYYFYNTFGDDCSRNNFYHGLNGITKKDFVRYIVLEIGCKYNNFYSNVTTSGASYLQRIIIKGLDNSFTQTDTILTLPANTDYEWVVAKNSDGTIEQYCPEDHYLTEAQKTKLAGIATGAEVNVNADWNATTGDARILNKPTSMPASDVSAWAKAATKPSYTFNDITNKPNTLSGYGITDVPNDNKTYGRKNSTWSEIDTSGGGGGGGSTISITWSSLKTKRNNGTLIPGQSYRITDYVCTTKAASTKAVNNLFDIIVVALDSGTLSENASATYHAGEIYFVSNDSNLESWELKYCIDNDVDRFAWADATNGKGVIYYMKDDHNNECPYDFKNIQFWTLDGWFYTFGSTFDNSVVIGYDPTSSTYMGCTNNRIGVWIDNRNQVLKYQLSFNTFGRDCCYNTLDNNCRHNKFGDSCQSNTFGDDCRYNEFGYGCQFNTIGNGCGSNKFNNRCCNNVVDNKCLGNKFGLSCNSNKIGNESSYNTLGEGCNSNTFGNYCSYNNFYHGSNGTTPKDYIRYVVLEDGCKNNTFYSNVTTSSLDYLQRIRIKGLDHSSNINTTITLSEKNIKYEWLICYSTVGTKMQYSSTN